MTIYQPGDLVARYINNDSVYEELLIWGIVLEVSSVLKDVLVLDSMGNTNWFPSFQWATISNPRTSATNIIGTLA